jgi:hypothetical protein
MAAPTTTRFGSSLTSPTSAAGVLRARASQMGVDLEPADDVDLAAAAIGADAWLLCTGAVDLSRSMGMVPGAAEALSRVLMRAAGRPVPLARDTEPPAPFPDDMRLVHAASAYLEWVEEHFEDHEPLRRAADDLAVGALRPVAVVLRSTADAASLIRPPQ